MRTTLCATLKHWRTLKATATSRSKGRFFFVIVLATPLISKGNFPLPLLITPWFRPRASVASGMNYGRARKGTCRQMVLRTLERAGRTVDKFTAYATLLWLGWCCSASRKSSVKCASSDQCRRGAKRETDDVSSFDEISYLPDVQIIPMLANIYINKSCKML